MKVTWVHPSWRDLVIEHLSADDTAREHFLRTCSVHGVLLALSCGGGASGERRMPLLKADGDWDALTDRLYALAPELEDADLIGILNALRVAIDDETETLDVAEAQALSRALLARLSAMWHASGSPIPLPVLEAWLELGARLVPHPAPPALDVTWAELLPAGPPDIGDRVALERFGEWLRLVERITIYDANMLGELGFPGRSLEHCEALVAGLEAGLGWNRANADQLAHVLGRMKLAMPRLTEPADSLLFHVAHRALEAREAEAPPTDWPRPRDPSNDVARVLRDL